MRLGSNARRTAAVIAVVLLLLGTTGVAGAAATDNSATDNKDATQVGNVDIKIAGENATVSGVDLSGKGLPTVDIHERTYTLHGSSVATDGFTVTVNDHSYEFGSVSIVLEDISVTLENVHIGE